MPNEPTLSSHFFRFTFKNGEEQTHLEIIRASREKLIANMERARRLNPSEIPLTSAHTPGLVADVDEDVISACVIISYMHVKRKSGEGGRRGWEEGEAPLNAQKGSREPTTDRSTVFCTTRTVSSSCSRWILLRS